MLETVDLLREERRVPAFKVDSPIKEACAEKGHSYTWFARQMKIHRTHMWQIEHGMRPTPPLFYERAALILGTTVEKLRPQSQEAVA